MLMFQFGSFDVFTYLPKAERTVHGAGAGDGSTPSWNEKFTFKVEYPGSGDDYKLTLKIMDKDTFSADDFVGQAT